MVGVDPRRARPGRRSGTRPRSRPRRPRRPRTCPSRPASTTASARSSASRSTRLARCSPRAIAFGSARSRLDLVRHRPAVGDRERGFDHVAVLQATQRGGGLGVHRRHRRVPGAATLAVRLVAGAAGTRGERRAGTPTSRGSSCGERAHEVVERLVCAASRARTPGPRGAGAAAGRSSTSGITRNSPVCAASSESATARLVASDIAAFCSSDARRGRKRNM